MMTARIFFLCLFCSGILPSWATYSHMPIGINYGQVGDNLPTPQKAVSLIQSTTITKVKIYDANPAVIEAFANTGIELIVMVKNEDIHLMLDADKAQKWVQQNVAAYMPASKIKIISVGNEILTGTSTQIYTQLVPAMQNIHAALLDLKIDNLVKVSTPHSLAVLSSSYPPSSGTFRPDIAAVVVKPMLQFLSETGSPFMVNTYPYFAYKSDRKHISLAYAMFLQNDGIKDPKSGLHYNNLLDAQLDAVYTAMRKMGFLNVPVIVSETGWPSDGDTSESGVSVNNAMVYTRNLIKHVSSGVGTPLNPGCMIDTYIFALFNENQKPGPATERNFGLFRPDMSFIYDAGLFKSGNKYMYGATPPPHIPLPPSTPAPTPYVPNPTPNPPYNPAPSNPAPSNPTPSNPTPSNPGTGGTRVWCISKPGTEISALAQGLNFACGEGGADCSAIQPNGPCFNPNTLNSHASYAFNSYFHKHGRNYWNCYFNNNALLTISDPSYGSCIYTSQ